MRVFKKSKFGKKTALALLTGAVAFLFALGIGPFGGTGLSLQAEAAENVEINETNFPDEIFRVYVSENFDSDGDGNLSESEIASVGSIDVNDKGITSLKGVEYFTGLEKLYCHNNQLTSLDVGKNTALVWLSCYNNQLTSLDVSKNTALVWLLCSDNQLTSLDVSKNTTLEDLFCNNNYLTSLDVGKNTALVWLWCSANQLTSLDVSKNTALEKLYCGGNQLTSLDVSKNTAMKELACSTNQLTSLDVSKNTALETLFCEYNELTSLDVSKNTALETLFCGYNELTSLDVSNCPLLEKFICNDNSYNIGKVDAAYSLINLPGFDASKASGWTGAAYDSAGNSLKNFTGKTVTYTYDCGQNKNAAFTLVADSITEELTPQEQQLRAFVSRMYTVALGREAETDGLDFYTDRLFAGDSNGACLAESFLTSPEFKGKGYDDAQYVKVLYRTFFDREPAAEEVNYWVEKLASGQPRAFVLSGFVNSVEFDNLCTSYGISRGFMKEDGKPLNPGIGRFVERFYTVVLERAGEKEGIEYWSLQIANGKCTPKDAAKSFFLSEEYINKNTSDEKYIITLYKTFMDREPEDGGIEYWQGVLNGGATREQILEGFADSAEFQGIMAGFGL